VERWPNGCVETGWAQCVVTEAMQKTTYILNSLATIIININQ